MVRDATKDSATESREGLTAWGIALAVHLAVAIVLLLAHGQWPRMESASPGMTRVALRLTPEMEGPRSSLVAAAALPGNRNPQQEEQVVPPQDPQPEPASMTPEEPSPSPPPQATPTPRTGLDEQTLRELEREREQLRAAVAREKGAAGQIAERLARQAGGGQSQQPAEGTSPVKAARPAGTVRQLDLSGHPEPVLQEIMDRYKLRVTQRALTSGISQNFLSSASTADGGHFTADRGGAPGIYEVFLLSPAAVAAMSRLEEEEIRRRGMDPMRTRVHRVKFGVVRSQEGQYDLGVLLLEAEEIGT